MPVQKEAYRDYFTYTQYKNWPEDERWELIDGQAYDMSPAPGTAHQEISGSLFNQIYNYLDNEQCKVFAAPFDVMFPGPAETIDQTDTVVQPDISIICNMKRISEKGCTGPPDVIIEIVSPSSASRDLIIKRDLYEKKCVNEYWIIHPGDKIVWKYLLKNGSYGKPFVFDYTGTPSFERLPGLKLDLKKVFGVPDSDEGAAEESSVPPGGGNRSRKKRNG